MKPIDGSKLIDLASRAISASNPGLQVDLEQVTLQKGTKLMYTTRLLLSHRCTRARKLVSEYIDATIPRFTPVVTKSGNTVLPPIIAQSNKYGYVILDGSHRIYSNSKKMDNCLIVWLLANVDTIYLDAFRLHDAPSLTVVDSITCWRDRFDWTGDGPFVKVAQPMDELANVYKES